VRYVLHTNIVIAALKQHPGVLSKLADVDAADVGIPLLVVGELMFGALRSQRVEANLEEIRRLRSHFPILPVGEAVIERSAGARARLADRGSPKGDFDLIIAWTAMEHAATLVTNDGGLKDGTVDGLAVEDWLS
jgi:tRNA(fMet)-specific endonuclease VapC